MKVLNEYSGSHHYWDTYEKSDYYCPLCGSQSVWYELGGGDYYVGVEYLCTNCCSVSYLDGVGVTTNENHLSIIDQLSSGRTQQPTTPKGV